METDINRSSLRLSLLEKTEDFRANIRRVKFTAKSMNYESAEVFADRLLQAIEGFIDELKIEGRV